MLLLRLVGGCVFLAYLASAVDPRALASGTSRSASSGTSRAAIEPTYEQIVLTLEDLTRRFTLAERDLLLATYQYEEARDTIDAQNERLAEFEERLQRTEECNCQGGGEGTPLDEPEDAWERDLGDWVENLNPDSIRGITDGFARKENERGRGRSFSDDVNAVSAEDDGTVELNPEAISILSKAFADLITQQAEDEGLTITDDVNDVQEKADEQVKEEVQEEGEEEDGQENPKTGAVARPRPGFPFRRPGQRRTRRDVTRSDLEEQLGAAFESLVRAKKDRSAFTAIRTTPLLGSSSPQVITFNEIRPNKGKDFDRGEGYFKCEIPGTYYFSFTIRSFKGKHIGVALMLNEAPICALTTDPSDRSVMQSQSVMVDMSPGDVVWLLLGPNANFGLYGNEVSFNTFNGHLVYAK